VCIYGLQWRNGGRIYTLRIYYNNNMCCGPEIKATLVIIHQARADGKHNLQMEISASPLARTRRPVAMINYIGIMYDIMRSVTYYGILFDRKTVVRRAVKHYWYRGIYIWRVNGKKY